MDVEIVNEIKDDYSSTLIVTIKKNGQFHKLIYDYYDGSLELLGELTEEANGNKSPFKKDFYYLTEHMNQHYKLFLLLNK